MTVLEFVVFDAHGKEVDWIDPVIEYRQNENGTYIVDNGFHEYEVSVPDSGSVVVRPRKDA